MTILWFVVWFVCDRVGDRESLLFGPPNVWAATLLLAVALDVNRPPVASRRRR
jgi:hypothetical protein